MGRLALAPWVARHLPNTFDEALFQPLLKQLGSCPRPREHDTLPIPYVVVWWRGRPLPLKVRALSGMLDGTMTGSRIRTVQRGACLGPPV